MTALPPTGGVSRFFTLEQLPAYNDVITGILMLFILPVASVIHENIHVSFNNIQVSVMSVSSWLMWTWKLRL